MSDIKGGSRLRGGISLGEWSERSGGQGGASGHGGKWSGGEWSGGCMGGGSGLLVASTVNNTHFAGKLFASNHEWP